MLRVMNFLIIEDDELTRLSLSRILAQHGQVTAADSYHQYLAQFHEKALYDFLFLDIDLEERGVGLEVLRNHSHRFKYKVVLSGREDKHSIAESYALGANDFLSKPFDFKDLEQLLQRAKVTGADLPQKIQGQLNFQSEQKVQQVHQKLLEAAQAESLLITGATGTGKTQLAKFVHENILQGPFVHINCAEIPESLVESELFGHRRGAFTGAVADYSGKLCLADGGVLFLDEITTLSVSMQRKLLAAIEEKSFFPVGSKQKVSSNFYLISATCDDVQKAMDRLEFRPDLYYRISGSTIDLPELKNRKEDLESFIQSFEEQGRRVLFSDEALQTLMEYDFPGNIRELKHIVQKLKTKENGLIESQDVLRFIQARTVSMDEIEGSHWEKSQSFIGEHGLGEYLKRIEKMLVNKYLAQNNQHVRNTIKDLKISQSTYYRIINN